ncbi:hypothetical protein AKJ09_04395 [Labilithrix luteola]|uniref:Uncharacterized protein n=1 Tax=Labilithrix luteola TaxID=1391654 RepID=A0A0K1PWI5_9BACT|nr:hypothetical protein AKJ09_04395 [Labilithrix luteola]
MVSSPTFGTERRGRPRSRGASQRRAAPYLREHARPHARSTSEADPNVVRRCR